MYVHAFERLFSASWSHEHKNVVPQNRPIWKTKIYFHCKHLSIITVGLLFVQDWFNKHKDTRTCMLLRQRLNLSHSRLLAADTQCLWLPLCYHFSSLCPWPQSHMQAISVQLLLAENDFMSDLLETERRGGGLCHCVHGKLTALKQHDLTVL